MRTVYAVLIVAQALTLFAATYAAFVAAAVNREAEHRADRSASHTRRANALEEKGDFRAAAAAHQRAARIAGHPNTIESALDAALRADAMVLITAPALPGPGMRARVDALVDALTGLPRPVDKVAAAALSAVQARMDGNLVAAIERIEAAEKDGITSVWLDWQMGVVRLREGRTDDAIERLEKVAKAQPQFTDGLHRLGLAYLAAERREAAIGALQRAIEAGGHTDASLDLARIFLGQQMWAEAIPHLERVLRGRGADSEALRLLAAAHFRLGRHALAARTYQQAHRVDNDPRTLLSAAIALASGGKQGEALVILDTLMPRVDALPEVAWQRGRILFDLGRRGEGQAAFQRYLAAAAGRPEEAERVARTRQLLAGGPPPRQPAQPAVPAMPAPGDPPPVAPTTPRPPNVPVGQPHPHQHRAPAMPAPAPAPAKPPAFVPADEGMPGK